MFCVGRTSWIINGVVDVVHLMRWQAWQHSSGKLGSELGEVGLLNSLAVSSLLTFLSFGLSSRWRKRETPCVFSSTGVFSFGDLGWSVVCDETLCSPFRGGFRGGKNFVASAAPRRVAFRCPVRWDRFDVRTLGCKPTGLWTSVALINWCVFVSARRIKERK